MSNMFTYLTPQFVDAIPREEEEETYVSMATLECSLTHWVFNQFFLLSSTPLGSSHLGRNQ